MLLPPTLGGILQPPAQPTPSAAADTQRPFVQFGANTGSVPPADKYITKDDHVQVTLLTSLAGPFWFSARILMPNGQITVQQERIVAAGTRALEFFSFVMPEGFLLSLDVAQQATNPSLRGQTWVRIAVQRALGNANPLQTVIAQGYLTVGASVGWPAMLAEYLSRGPGATIVNTVSNPAAGADWSLTVPLNAAWLVRTISAVFTTSVAVANRSPRLQYTDGTTVILDHPQPLVIAASTAARVTWSPGAANSGPVASNQSAGITGAIRLQGNFVIRTTTSLIDVADQWSSIRVVVEEQNGLGG